MLLRVYAKCIDGQDEALRRRVMDALGHPGGVADFCTYSAQTLGHNPSSSYMAGHNKIGPSHSEVGVMIEVAAGRLAAAACAAASGAEVRALLVAEPS